MNEKELFYEACGGILGTIHNYKQPVSRITRWNNRSAGNGRYEGFGLIRFFGPNKIHIALNHPERVNKTCSSKDEVFTLLHEVMTAAAFNIVTEKDNQRQDLLLNITETE